MNIIELSLGNISPEAHFEKEASSKNQLYLIKNHFQSTWNNKIRLVISLHYFSQSSFFPSLISIVNSKIKNHLEAINKINKKEDLKIFLKSQNHPVIDEKAIMEMKPITVKKPWGREIWYTGIEKRGVVDIDIKGLFVSFPDLLDMYPTAFLGEKKTPILVKTLETLPKEIYGDLYLELHEKKQEVYIVTQINKKVYPNEVGRMKYGFEKNKLKALGWENFKKSYNKAIKNYEQIRKKIDEKWDKFREEKNSELNKVADANNFDAWYKGISPKLIRDEERLRKEVDSFSGYYPLTVGDVVKVDTLVPHSLQHGVRVVEFQTPVYERLILCFAQKTLTQGHWDTDKAIDLMKKTYPLPQTPKVLKNETGVLVEAIGDFKDFKVMRITLDEGKKTPLFHFIPENASYSFVFGLMGKCELKKKSSHNKSFTKILLTEGKCFFFPKKLGTVDLETKTKSVFLVTYPL